MAFGFGSGFIHLSGSRAGGGGAWSPAALFAASEVGVWYDPSDLSTVWQDNARTTPGAVNAVVGCIDDKSGNGFNAVQATTSLKPILRQSGGLYYLEGDGVDDVLQSTAIVLAQPATWVAALLHVTSSPNNTATGAFCVDGGVNVSATSNNSGGIYQRSDGANRIIRVARRIGAGTANLASLASAFVVGTPYIAVGKTQTSPDQLSISVGAAPIVAAATYDGTPGATAARIFHNGAAAQLGFYGGLQINRDLTTDEVAALRTYLADKSGAAA